MIRIPSKSQKEKSQLLDALRILAWTSYKSDNKESKLKGLELYKVFEEEWLEHEIHALELPELKKFIQEELGYSERELNQIRERHYQNRPANGNGNGNGEAPASKQQSEYQESQDDNDEPQY